MPEIGKEVGKERILGGLLKTGQTTSYNSYADDGYYEKGLSKQYTILTAGQYDGTTSITLNLKTDVHSNNCVYDRRTKLTWSRYISASLGPASNGKLPWTTNASGEGIFAYCAAANVAKLAGYSDWRIPNIFELFSLSDLGKNPPFPDSIAFPSWGTDDRTYSSTTAPNNTLNGITLNFNIASVSSNVKTTSNYYCILVRGG